MEKQTSKSVLATVIKTDEADTQPKISSRCWKPHQRKLQEVQLKISILLDQWHLSFTDKETEAQGYTVH